MGSSKFETILIISDKFVSNFEVIN